jgi:hypothetical protein
MEQTGKSYTTARANLLAAWKAPRDDARGLPRSPPNQEQKRCAHWPCTARGGIDTLAAMTQLARSFPTLRDAAGGSPWDASRYGARLSLSRDALRLNARR